MAAQLYCYAETNIDENGNPTSLTGKSRQLFLGLHLPKDKTFHWALNPGRFIKLVHHNAIEKIIVKTSDQICSSNSDEGLSRQVMSIGHFVLRLGNCSRVVYNAENKPQDIQSGN